MPQKSLYHKILGISLDINYGYVNNKKYNYPKAGKESYLAFDNEILKRFEAKRKIFYK